MTSYRLGMLLAFLAPGLFSGCAPGDTRSAMALTADDRAAIRALDSTFVQGWLRDDTTAVLSVFRADAVLLPPGSQAVSGLTAIQSYWWPTDGTHTRITSFDRRIIEIEGTRGLAYVRGTAALGWNLRRDFAGTEVVAQSSKSADLVLVAPDSSGRWRVIRQVWGTLP